MTKLWVILLLWTGVIVSAGCSSSSNNEEEVQTVDAPQDGEEVVEEVEEIVDGGDGYEIVDEAKQAGLPEEVTANTNMDTGRQAYMEPGSQPPMEKPNGAPAVAPVEKAEPMEPAQGMNAQSYAQPETPAAEPDRFAMDPGGEEMPMAEEASANVPESEMEAPAEKAAPLEEPKKKYVPVKKIAELPWSKDGAAVNAIYIVRPGDTMDTISAKIYGSSSRADELYNINPHLRRGMKVGDKVYYNSPVRPNDMNTLLTFYEDNGVSPQMYVAKPGDNIRKVAENLLGHPRSWMEVWATNPNVESKWELAEGTELRYWPPNMAVGGPGEPDSSGMTAPPEDGNPYQNVDEPESAVSEISPEQAMPPKTGSGEALPPVNDSMPEEATALPPPPPMETGESQDMADLGPGMDNAGDALQTPPPPPVEPLGTPSLPDEAVAPPPPPPPPKPMMKKPRPKKAEGGLDAFLADEFNLMLAAGVLFIIVAGALIVVRKRRQSRRINLSETQV